MLRPAFRIDVPVAVAVLEGDGKGLEAESRFSSPVGELGGSRASLLGTGVDSLAEDVCLGLGRALALLVSCRHDEGR